MNLQKFATAQVLFHETDPADCVYYVIAGEVEIIRSVGEETILIGSVSRGEFLGEMSVLEERNHSATARAAREVDAVVIPRGKFLEQISTDPNLSRALLLRLSRRLRDANERVADFASSATKVDSPRIQVTIAAGSQDLRSQMGSVPITLQLPSTVGRVPTGDDLLHHRFEPDLLLNDSLPFRLSRNHFVIEAQGEKIVVRDLDSTLGTTVNGYGIGTHFSSDIAPLNVGDNRVIAGGHRSPFIFNVTIAAAHEIARRPPAPNFPRPITDRHSPAPPTLTKVFPDMSATEIPTVAKAKAILTGWKR